nr:MAG TPA: hypothetical protein [Caudoviricetes sp.]
MDKLLVSRDKKISVELEGTNEAKIALLAIAVKAVSIAVGVKTDKVLEIVSSALKEAESK